MVRLAMKAFHPGTLPFPLLHVDTTWKFREMFDLPRPVLCRARAAPDRPRQPERRGARAEPDHARQQEVDGRHEDAGPAAGARAPDGSTPRSAAPVATRRNRARRSVSTRSATATTSGTRRTSGRSSGISTTGEIDRGESIRVFPLSNWTELDVWQYIHLEHIPVVPLYFAAVRPTVERDGMILMVDDDRLPLQPGELVQQRLVRFRTLGCYPFTGAVESAADHGAGDHRGDAGGDDVRAAGAGDRPRRVGLDGAEEEGRLLLMAGRSAAEDIDAYLAAQERKELLRFLTAGSVDDGKSTLIGRLLLRHAADLRGSARGGAARQRAEGDDGRRDRSVAAHGRPQGRARAGHHDRRRLPLLLDQPAQVHHRRLSGPRAVHAQHGDGRVELRPRHHPDRRAARRAAADARATASSSRCSGIRHVVVAVNKMDLVGWSEDALRARSGTTTRISPPGWTSRDLRFIPLSALLGDNVVEPSAAHAVVPGRDAAAATWRPCTSPRTAT